MMATSQRYQEKVTVITGGSKGIGKGCVHIFVKNGAKVVFCARGEVEGKQLESEMNQMGPGEAFFIACDVSKEEDIKIPTEQDVAQSEVCLPLQQPVNLIDKTVEKYGRIDCLINNAGYHPPHQPIDDVSASDFRNLLDLNLISYFLASKFALPHLRKTQGNIINDSSLVSQIGQMGAVMYVATKGAITSMTKALAIDEARHGVRVNAFSPGNIWTPLWETTAKSTGNLELAKKGGEDAQLSSAFQGPPPFTRLIGRFGTIEECGEACLFLAAEGTFCTGIDLNLSGGAELNYGIKNMKLRTSIFE